jgi:predicted ATP-grasp superfamily ATP-dependent carboligase
VQVHVGWHKADGVASKSRYIFKAHDLPPFNEKDPAWKQALVALLEEEHFDLIIPCSDLETVAVQTNRAELERHGRVYAINDQAFEVLFDKFRTTEMARSLGLRTPREVVVKTLEQAERALPQFRFPVVLKPPRTIDPANAERINQVRKAYTEEEYRKFMAGMLKSGSVSVQENFIGYGTGVELLLNRGEPLMVFQHMRVHEPLKGGPSCYRKGVKVWPELLDASLKILRALDYTGVAMVEFKVNPETRDWVLLEINARFWGSLPLALASGADFPLALFQMLVEERRAFPCGYRTGIHSRNLTRDLEWWKENLRADRNDPTLSTQPILRVIGDACVNTLLFRERIDTFAFDDPQPCLAEFGRFARAAVRHSTRSFRRLMPRPGPARVPRKTSS